MNQACPIEMTPSGQSTNVRNFLAYAAMAKKGGDISDLLAFMEKNIPTMLTNPVKQLKLADGHYGCEILGHYRVLVHPKSPFYVFQINKSNKPFNKEAYEIYKPEYTDQLITQTEMREEKFKWIFDIEVSGSKDVYDSHKWLIGGALRELDYFDLAIAINIASFFGIIESLDNGVMAALERNKVEYVAVRDERLEIASAIYHFISVAREHYLDSFRLCLGKQSIDGWSKKVHRNLRESFKFCAENNKTISKWFKRYELQNKRFRLSNYNHFINKFIAHEEGIERVERYSKAQAFYIFVFENDPQAAFDDLNYFSHANIVSSFEDFHHNFKFPKKSALKRFNLLSPSFLKAWVELDIVNKFDPAWLEFVEDLTPDAELLIPLQVAKKQIYLEPRWVALMYWLCYGQNIEAKAKTVPRRLREFLRILSVSYLTKNGAEVAKVVDFFYRIDSEFKAELKQIKKREDLSWEQEGCSSYEYEKAQMDRYYGFILDFVCSRQRDTDELCNLHQIGKTTTFHSALRKAFEWHDALQYENLEATLKTREFKEYKWIDKSIYRIKKSIVFTPLRSNHDMIKEAVLMKNCLFDYIYRVEGKDYVAYHIESEGGEKATLGMFVGYQQPFMFDQVYGENNSTVSEEIRDAAMMFVQKLNKQHSR